MAVREIYSDCDALGIGHALLMLSFTDNQAGPSRGRVEEGVSIPGPATFGAPLSPKNIKYTKMRRKK